MGAMKWLLVGGAVIVGIIFIHNYMKMGGLQGAERQFIGDLRTQQGHPLTPAQQHAATQIAHGYY
jgi:hypothetical protein